MLIALGLSGLVVVGVASLLAALPEPEGDLLLVIVPPWRAAETIVHAGGGQIVGPLRAPLSVLVSGGDARRMEEAGGADLWFGMKGQSP